ncbi:MAG: helix-turn-helix domain-containing protein [Roseburia sp.]|nr:helix-turn-helix domain-containing protein [Roseburia sp.]MCM1099582.1 helix-turn-helix domain-containing protein [Ruminococcus flavefaciens]
MEIKDMLKGLREKNQLTQEQMAKRLMVTRQAVSRWETGETQPNTDTLKLLSQEFNVSINTLLGSPRQLICQCCGMPLSEDNLISREPDGSYNEDYCKWCYTDGQFVYPSMDSLLDYLVGHMPNPDHLAEDELRQQFTAYLSQLKHWNSENKSEELS